jgi:hypothetical protein|tara:strand:- start:885 stop:1082 length:198 start_codon:yes stop_codon:yes gene_type:complete
MSKQWKQIKIFETFEEADVLRQKMLEGDKTSKLEIKIRRCGDEGKNFKVKSYYPAPPPINKKKKE